MFFLRRYILFLFLFILPASASALERLAYYSDYFSFIGGDGKGFVAFSLDNNRGIDGSDYQAEHFGVLYDEASGWVKLRGTGDYENVQGELERIPNSPHFTFEGRPKAGIVVSSHENALSLEIDPLVTQLKEKTDNRTRKWGAGNAVLNWKDREIQGRVIYEQLIYRDWNRLTRTYAGTWDNFQGFYLLLRKGGFDTWRDLYLSSQGAGDSRRTRGFVTVDEWSGTIRAKRFTAFDKALNWGFYRWPQKRDVEVVTIGAVDTKTGKLSLRQISRKNQDNWVIGGFAMTVVAGEFHLNGEVIPVIGFIELIK
jgi:hypothetical protein